MKTLYRSRTNKKIAGICGGIGEFFNMDPTIVRFIFVVIFILPPYFFLEVIAYIILWFVIPLEPKEGKKIA